MSKKKPIFEKSVGPSRRDWNNLHVKLGAAVCELCGTGFPESEEGYAVSRFLGYQVVEDCCGRVLDIVFEESGQEFTEAMLEDFASDPFSQKFGKLRWCLKEMADKVVKEFESSLKEFKSQIQKLTGLSSAAQWLSDLIYKK